MTTKPELKIIADHLRSSCFLIADGVMPSNEGRGYVLRRIMRRAMRQIHKLGAKQAVMYKLVDSLIKEMGTAYPELSRARDTIIDTLKNEEEKFRETLEKGLKILEDAINHPPLKGGSKSAAIRGGVKFSGETAFKLYDTYGFPLDLTQDILKEKNIEVDIEEFNREMELQRERARKNWTGSGEEKEDKSFYEKKEKHGETIFLGYENFSNKAKVIDFALSNLTNIPYGIILDQTSFYATSGGQKGDDGLISLASSPDVFVTISETKKFAGNLFVHLVSTENGSKNNFKIGDEVIAEVNRTTRNSRAANHSATHLMHKALKEVLGNSISQKGSNVDAEYFTFDFNFNRAMTGEEIKKVEDLVNSNIKQKNVVNTNLMPLKKARESGAEALFGEKYDSEVRVVKMGSSVELCGGTHVKNTSEIEAFKIISEKSVASGIRRIEAKTASGLKKYLDEQEEKSKNKALELYTKISDRNKEISSLSGTQISNTHSNESDVKILEEILKQKDKEIERLKKQILLSGLSNLKSEKIGEINLLNHVFHDVDAKDLREITNELKAKKDFVNSHIFVLFGCKEDKVAVVVAVSDDLLYKFDSAKLIAPLIEAIGGKGGGGKKDLAMGGGVDKNSIKKAVEVLKGLIQ